MENFKENLDFKDDVNIREELEKYLAYWRWFLVCIIISLALAYVNLRYSTILYTASSSIMIKDNQKSGISDELKAVADLGIVGSGSTNNPDNEIHVIKSRKIIADVVDSLQLNIRYFTEGKIKTYEIYHNPAFKIEFIDKDSLFYRLNTTVAIKRTDKKRFDLNDLDGNTILSGSFDKIISSNKLGNFKIIPRDSTFSDQATKELIVSITPRERLVDAYQSKIEVKTLDKLSSVLILTLTDPIKTKAEDILNVLVEEYNQDAITDKNLVSNKTKYFIEERLRTVGLELAEIQDNFKDYKSKFGISGLTEEGEMALSEVSETNKKIVELKTQLSLVEWVQEEIKKSTKAEVLPANLGFSDAITSESITRYNQLVLEKYRLEPIAGKKNPNLIALNNEIDVLKQNLQSNLANLKKSIEIQITKVSNESNRVQNKVAQLPLIERGIIDIERQKIIYSELYSYLLKKKEETAISLAITVPNAKIIDRAYSNGNPVSPNKKTTYLIGFFLGFIIPFAFIYIKNLLDTKIHSRKQMEQLLTVPFLGDIPHSE
ncbi:MAG: chain length determinant protein, partial [Flavobacteriia bacterium]|nr:chain length determinant protein [Flavobacteriia bacterium]